MDFFKRLITAKLPKEQKLVQQMERTDMKNSYGSFVMASRGNPVRVVTMSDIHSKQFKLGTSYDRNEGVDLGALPSGDFLIISGDLTQKGKLDECIGFNAFLKQIVDLNKYKHIVFIGGNHEKTLDRDHYLQEGWRYDEEKQDPSVCTTALLHDLPSNVHYLQDSAVQLEGLLIYGTPWVLGGHETFSSDTSPSHYRWGFTLPGEELPAKWDLIPDDVDILITHQPPRGIGDMRRDYDGDYEGEDGRQHFAFSHEGCPSLAERLAHPRGPRPLLHVFGHEHYGYGAFQILSTPSDGHQPRTVCVNAAICDEDYYPTHRPIVVDITRSHTSVSHRVPNSVYLDTAVAALVALRKHVESSDGVTECGATARALLLTAASASTCERELMALETRLLGELDALDLLEQALPDGRRQSCAADEDSPRDFRRAQLVLPGVYLGPASVLGDEVQLTAHNFSHVLSCIQEAPEEAIRMRDAGTIHWLHVVAEDVEEQSLIEDFPRCIDFIAQAVNEGGAVLVHCRMGISRSASIVIAYIMRTMNCSYDQALVIVRRARPFAYPNEGFAAQLKQFSAHTHIPLNMI